MVLNEFAASKPGNAVIARSLLKTGLLILTGFVVWLLVPGPAGVSSADWNFFILFIFTIIGIVWQPLPMGVIILASLSLGSGLHVFSVEQALKGYSNGIGWIIVSAFLFARAFVKTGLGRRIALWFIRHLGKSSLRLGYSLALTDLVLAPVTASNTARAGGIIFPVARSLAQEFQSEPGPSAGRIGAYLLFTSYQADIITSALFLTAMAANGLSIEIARKTAGVEITWGLWLLASILPGLVSLLVVPYLVHRTYPPELDRTPEAQDYARRELAKLGPPSREERILMAVFMVLAAVWATSVLHSISTVTAALGAVCVLLATRVLEWDDVAGDRRAWGTFIWFGGVVSLAGILTGTQLISWFVAHMSRLFGQGRGLEALLVLIVIYVYVHYGFASMTSQIIALYGPFLAIAIAAGAPPLLAALAFCFFSNLYASLTHYGDGAAPIFYGSGYIDQKSWWRVGLYISIANLVIWLGVGLPWWHLMGIW